MAGTRITLEIDGRAQFDRVFRRIDFHLTDLRPAWETVRDVFWEIEQDQFQSEGAAGASGKWKPLSKKYEAQKINKYGTFALLAGVLIASEALYKSLTRQTGDTVLDIQKDSITIGTKLPYAKYHQRGGGRLPQRKIIDFSEKQKTSMMKGIQKTMVSEMRKSKIPIESGITVL